MFICATYTELYFGMEQITAARYLSDRELCIVLLSYSYGLLFPDFCSYIALFLLLGTLQLVMLFLLARSTNKFISFMRNEITYTMFTFIIKLVRKAYLASELAQKRNFRCSTLEVLLVTSFNDFQFRPASKCSIFFVRSLQFLNAACFVGHRGSVHIILSRGIPPPKFPFYFCRLENQNLLNFLSSSTLLSIGWIGWIV